MALMCTCGTIAPPFLMRLVSPIKGVYHKNITQGWAQFPHTITDSSSSRYHRLMLETICTAHLDTLYQKPFLLGRQLQETTVVSSHLESVHIQTQPNLQNVRYYCHLASLGSRFKGLYSSLWIARVHHDVKQTQQGSDVLSEIQRVENSPGDALRVLHVSKSFSAHNPVVSDLTFGVKSSECFALLVCAAPIFWNDT
jgi:hypothetical protein